MPTENLDSALKAGELIEETAAARESAKNDLNLVLDNYASILKKTEPVDTTILGEIARIRQAMESTTGIIPEEDYKNISTAAGSPISREAYDELIRLRDEARQEYAPFLLIPLVSAFVGANVFYDTYAEMTFWIKLMSTMSIQKICFSSCLQPLERMLALKVQI